MIETIKHLTGMCGESHLNLFTLTLLIIFIKYAVYTLGRNIYKSRYNQK